MLLSKGIKVIVCIGLGAPRGEIVVVMFLLDLPLPPIFKGVILEETGCALVAQKAFLITDVGH